MILVIDNYDSFTWNLVHYVMELGAEVEVVRNDALTAVQAIEHLTVLFVEFAARPRGAFVVHDPAATTKVANK